MNKLNKNYYLWNGEAVVLLTVNREWNGKEYVVNYDHQKFNGIPCIEDNGTFAVVKVADIEAAGTEINPEEVCLSYDDFYAGDWGGADEIQVRKVPNFENEEHWVYQYVTDSWYEEYLKEQDSYRALAVRV